MRYIVFILITACCFSLTASPINALALSNGASILSQTPSYSKSTPTASEISLWSQEALIDGNFSKGWCSKENAVLPVEFIFELSESFILHQLQFGNACEMAFEGICARRVKVEISSTSSREGYTDLGVFELKENLFKQQFNIAPSKARWMRITILSNYGNKKFSELMEVQALGEYEEYSIASLPIEGVWETNWGWVSLNRNSHGLYHGCYKYNNGSLYASSVRRRVFEFEWEEKSINRRGWARLVINAEGNRLSGTWGLNQDKTRFGFWEFYYKSAMLNSCANENQFKNKSPEEGKYDIPLNKVEEIMLQFETVDEKSGKSIKGANADVFNSRGIKVHTQESYVRCAIPKGNYSARIHKKGYFYAEVSAFGVESTMVKRVKLKPIVPGERVVLEHVLFKQGTAELVDPKNQELDYLARMMKENRSLKLELSGHTDNQGNPADNLKLSEERAALIRIEIIQRGIDPERLISTGYGGSQPIADNNQESTRQLNRRVEAKVLEF